MRLARDLLMATIRGYKRRLSPHKRFACAYRVHLGACSCSTLGLRAISRYGAWRGLGVLRQRLRECHRVAVASRARRYLAQPAQGGFVDCDVPCEDVACCGDMPTMDGACEVLDCAGCGDWGGGDGWPWSTREPAAPASPARKRRRRGDPVAGQAGAGASPADAPPAP